jgi:hypothetical protein
MNYLFNWFYAFLAGTLQWQYHKIFLRLTWCKHMLSKSLLFNPRMIFASPIYCRFSLQWASNCNSCFFPSGKLLFLNRWIHPAVEDCVKTISGKKETFFFQFSTFIFVTQYKKEEKWSNENLTLSYLRGWILYDLYYFIFTTEIHICKWFVA